VAAELQLLTANDFAFRYRNMGLRFTFGDFAWQFILLSSILNVFLFVRYFYVELPASQSTSQHVYLNLTKLRE